MASTPQPTVQQVREELDRLLEDSTFRRAPSHSRLLRYLVERKTAGDDGALCEAGIAILLTEVTREFPDSADAWALRGRSCVRRINYGDLPAPPLGTILRSLRRRPGNRAGKPPWQQPPRTIEENLERGDNWFKFLWSQS